MIKLSNQQDREAKSRAQRAALDLDCWKSRFRLGAQPIKSEDQCKEEVSYVRHLITVMHSPDHLAAGRELEDVASFVRSESIYSKYSQEVCRNIVDGLLKEAAYEKDPTVSCPWRDCLEAIRSKPRLFELGTTLWTKNGKGHCNWRISLDELKREVWGDEETSTSTARSLVSEFRAQLREHDVPLTIKISDTRNNRWVRCSLS